MRKFLDIICQNTKSPFPENFSRVLCATSSGQDSILTFFLLLHLRSNLEVVYCQHFWQPKNFLSVLLVFQLSFLVDVPYTLILSSQSFVNENFSRNWRKKAFFRLIQSEKLSIVISGHTLTDNIEKNLTNLIRGTSPKTLSEVNFLNFKKPKIIYFSFKPLILNFSKFFKTNDTSLIFYDQILLFYRTDLNFSKNSFVSKHKRLKNQFEYFKTTPYSKKQATKKSLKKDKIIKIDGLSKAFVKTCFLKINHQRVKTKIQNFHHSTTIFWTEQQKIFLTTNKILEKESLISKNNLGIPKTMVLRNENKTFQRRSILHNSFRQFHNFLKRKNKISSKLLFFSFPFPVLEKELQGQIFLSKQIIKKNNLLGFSSSFCLCKNSFKTEIQPCKPLNQISRTSISKIVNFYNLPRITDLTNFSLTISRTRLRHQLIPIIGLFVERNIESSVIKFFSLLNQQQSEAKIQTLKVYSIFKIFQLATKNNFLIISQKKRNYLNPSSKRFELKCVQKFFQKQRNDFQGHLIQKLFFNYRNLELKFSQIFKIQSVIIKKRKV